MTIAPNPLPAKKGNGKPQTPEQEAAAKRNFAMFQLKGMLAHLKHLHGHVPPGKILDIQMTVQAALYELSHPVKLDKVAAPLIPYLQDWRVEVNVESGQLFIRGVIFGSTKIEDGTPVRTSYLCGADRSEGTVKTITGSTYLLRGGNADSFNRICLRFGA